MTKLYFDKNKLNNQITPYIKNGITKLNNATCIINRISIPSDFHYKTKTIISINNINTMTKELTKLNDWINSSQIEITQLMEEINNNINEVTITDIEERKNIIV